MKRIIQPIALIGALALVVVFMVVMANRLEESEKQDKINEEIELHNKRVDYYNDYFKMVEETANATETALNSYNTIQFLKDNPDYDIEGLSEKAENMLNRALNMKWIKEE